MLLYPRRRNVAAQVAEELKTVTCATPPSPMEERRTTTTTILELTPESRSKGTNDKTMNECTNHWIRNRWSHVLLHTRGHVCLCFIWTARLSFDRQIYTGYSFWIFNPSLHSWNSAFTSQQVNEWVFERLSEPVNQSASQAAGQSASQSAS